MAKNFHQLYVVLKIGDIDALVSQWFCYHYISVKIYWERSVRRLLAEYLIGVILECNDSIRNCSQVAKTQLRREYWGDFPIEEGENRTRRIHSYDIMQPILHSSSWCKNVKKSKLDK